MHRNKQSGFGLVGILAVLVILGLLGFISWRAYEANQKTHESPKLENASPETTNDTSMKDDIQWERIQSGKKAFSIQIPKGWGTILRPLTEDLLSIKGVLQPVYDADKSVLVQDIEGWGTDGPSVFTVFIHDNIAPPRGTSVEFKAGSLSGEKFTYIAEQDSERGMGQEDKGDKYYEYRFNLNDDKQLVVWYCVYINSDPNDQIEVVDKIVKSLQVQ